MNEGKEGTQELFLGEGITGEGVRRDRAGIGKSTARTLRPWDLHPAPPPTTPPAGSANTLGKEPRVAGLAPVWTCLCTGRTLGQAREL